MYGVYAVYVYIPCMYALYVVHHQVCSVGRMPCVGNTMVCSTTVATAVRTYLIPSIHPEGVVCSIYITVIHQLYTSRG